MTEMVDMSRAIRLEIEAKSTDGTLKGLSDSILADYVTIVGAFYADLRDELARRHPEVKP
jgi:hypothetical protein